MFCTGNHFQKSCYLLKNLALFKHAEQQFLSLYVALHLFLLFFMHVDHFLDISTSIITDGTFKCLSVIGKMVLISLQLLVIGERLRT